MDGRCAAFFEFANELFAIVGAGGDLERVNGAWRAAGLPAPDGEPVPLSSAVDSRDQVELGRILGLRPGQTSSQVIRFVVGDGAPLAFQVRASCDERGDIYIAARESEARRRMPTDQPLLAGKLQSMGELAAGIAHEINTPLQFVGNNLEFLEQAFTDLLRAVEASRRLASSLGDNYPELTQRILQRTNVDLLATEVPAALGESIAGVARVSEIVRAMNEFAHPQNDDRRLVDLHKIIHTAVSMTRSAWKYVAEIELDFDNDLPLVPAYGGSIGQVVLNLIINATHAIEEAIPDGNKGSIRIGTRVSGDQVHITIADSGCGMSAAVQERIFDPFFTTKKAGKGTGQGLALAHREITERHNGAIDVVSTPGQGTEFHIALPRMEAPREAAREIAS